MKYAAAKKISTQECYNNEYKVTGIYDKLTDAFYECNNCDPIIEVPNNIKVGDSIDGDGKTWVSKA